MKAIQIHHFGGPEVLKLEQLPDPKPASGQVLVRANAIGVNPVDVYIREGKYGDRTFPLVLGFDAAGIVEAIGDGVKSFKAGDRVYTYGSASGAYAELLLCKESQVHALPKNITFPQGAALGVPYITAHFALFTRGQAKTGETVFIHGASGGVGTAAIQIARAHGLTVIGTASTPKGRELIIKEGAHHALDHSAADYLDQLLNLTGDKGIALILEMLANVNLAKDLKVLAPRGRVVVVGNRGSVEINPREIMTRNADIRGMSIMYATEEELSAIHTAISVELKQGALKPVIGKEIPLAQVARAHEEIMKAGSYGKIILIPSI